MKKPNTYTDAGSAHRDLPGDGVIVQRVGELWLLGRPAPARIVRVAGTGVGRVGKGGYFLHSYLHDMDHNSLCMYVDMMNGARKWMRGGSQERREFASKSRPRRRNRSARNRHQKKVCDTQKGITKPINIRPLCAPFLLVPGPRPLRVQARVRVVLKVVLDLTARIEDSGRVLGTAGGGGGRVGGALGTHFLGLLLFLHVFFISIIHSSL